MVKRKLEELATYKCSSVVSVQVVISASVCTQLSHSCKVPTVLHHWPLSLYLVLRCTPQNQRRAWLYHHICINLNW